jgi:hypothetical protein
VHRHSENHAWTIPRILTTMFVAVCATRGSDAAEDNALPTKAPASCTVNDGEWYWGSADLEVTVGVDLGDVSYVEVDLHRAEVCTGVAPQGIRVAIPSPHGWTGSDCVWRRELCQEDSFGISMFVHFRQPEDHQAVCSFTLHGAQPACESCATMQTVTLTRGPITAVKSELWGTIKRLYK